MRRTSIVLLVLGIVGCSNEPPDRTSPELVVSTVALPTGDLVQIDLLDDRPAWIEPEGSDGWSVIDADGLVAPGHDGSTAPYQFRALEGPVVVACGSEWVGVFDGESWRQFSREDVLSEGTFYSCQGVDARAADDVWMLADDGGTQLCHFDGASWTCRTVDGERPHGLVLTAGAAFWYDVDGSSEDYQERIRILDTASPDGEVRVVALADGLQLARMSPIPGANAVVSTFQGYGDEEDFLPRVIDVDGTMGPAIGDSLRGYAPNIDVVPVSRDEHYLITSEASSDTECTGFIFSECETTFHWSQIVVHRLEGATLTELGHLSVLDVGHYGTGAMIDGVLNVRIGEAWYRVP